MAANFDRIASESSIFNLQITKETWDDVKEYKDEYKFIIKLREQNRVTFLHQSPQRSYRLSLVDYLKKVAEEKHLHYSCLHLAVYLLDVFMDKNSIMPEKLLLVTNVCLLLAAKIEENNANTPKIVELQALAQNIYSIDDHKLLEKLTLKFFNFNIMFPTPAHYTHYFMQALINHNDLEAKQTPLRSLILELHDVIRILLDRIIEEIHFMQCYKPSILAAAIMSTARVRNGLNPWTVQLESLSGYREEELRDLRDLMLQTKPLACIYCLQNPELYLTLSIQNKIAT